MTYHSDEDVYKAFADLLQRMKWYHSCLTCEHFQQEPDNEELCKLAGRLPPAAVIVDGCDFYSQEPPF